MPSQRSSKVVLTQGSPRSSTGSFSSSSSNRSSEYTNYGYTSYETSAATNMGRSGYADEGVREKVHRVPNAYRMTRIPNVSPPYTNSSPTTAGKETVTTTSRGKVDITNHDMRHNEKWEPRASDARSSDYHQSSSSRRNKK